MPGLTELERRCVAPFYLKMMGLNALSHQVPFGVVSEVARSTTDEEVAVLLASAWRPRVMGAWLASGRAERLETELLQSLETSAGLLTSPPLAAVALHGLGVRTVPSLQAYLRNDLDQQWGVASFTAAVLERVGSPSSQVAVTDRDRSTVDEMLTVTRRLAEALPAPDPRRKPGG